MPKHKDFSAVSSSADGKIVLGGGPSRGQGAGDAFNPKEGRSGRSGKGASRESSAPSVFGSTDDSSTASLLSQEGAVDDDVLGHSFKRRSFRADEELSVYSDEMRRRYGMDGRSKIMVGVAVALFVCTIAAIIIPNNATAVDTSFSFGWLATGVQNNLAGLLAFFSGARPGDSMQYKLFLYIVVALAGAALGVSGAVYQGSLRNALASPTTLGVVSGGTLGLTLYVVFCYEPSEVSSVTTAGEILSYQAQLSGFEHFAERYAQLGWTLAGCFIVVAFVLAVSLVAGRGKVSGDVLVITGQVVVMVVTSALAVVRTYYAAAEGADAAKAQALSSMRSSSFSGMYTLSDVVLMALPILVGVGVIVALRLRLNALTFSEEEARSMGLSVNATRNLMVAACTLMTAVVIAFCGSIGFVGFLVPHLTRRIVGPDFNYLMPASALVGALFMVLVYFVSSFFALESFGGVRLLTSVLGGVVFIVMALRSRGRSTSDAA